MVWFLCLKTYQLSWVILCESHPYRRTTVVECPRMVQETGVQSLVESYQRLKKWYLRLSCLSLSIIRYGSRVKGSNPRNWVAPFPTPRFNSYWKMQSKVPFSRPWRRSPTLLFYTFPKGICPKVNVIKRVEIELAYVVAAGQYSNHFTTRTLVIWIFTFNVHMKFYLKHQLFRLFR